MNRHASVANGDPQWIDDTHVPTAAQVLIHELPVTAMMMIGLPILVFWLLDTPTGDPRTPWWPVFIVAFTGAVLLTQRLLQAPRPRLNKQIGPGRLTDSLLQASRTGTMPADPGVRTAAGVTACYRIEAAMASVAVTVALLIPGIIQPLHSFIAAGTVSGIFALLHLSRARHSWAYLKALHTTSQVS
ncbi:hypothetical protein [Kocuria oceani]|uniref:Uncharacterized protein n=1 Tax=Kocuria oceani TaxID=988827 RepID=A0ABV9TN81_9MICC|nr:hypothetical protein [Kocuria oceani]